MNNHPYHMPYGYIEYPYYGIPENYMDFYDSRSQLMDMYPDIYRRVYPRVQGVCQHYDLPSNPRMYPRVDPTMVEEMVEEAYRLCTQEISAEQWGRGAIRDLVTILIIRELLGRRRRRPGMPYDFGGPFTGYPGPGYFY